MVEKNIYFSPDICGKAEKTNTWIKCVVLLPILWYHDHFKLCMMKVSHPSFLNFFIKMQRPINILLRTNAFKSYHLHLMIVVIVVGEGAVCWT